MALLHRGRRSRRRSPFLALGGATVAMLAVWTGLICHQLNFLLIGPREFTGRLEAMVQRLAEYKLLILSGLGVLATGLIGLALLPTSRLADSPDVLMILVFLMVSGATMALVGVIVRVVWAVGEKQKALIKDELPVDAGRIRGRPSRPPPHRGEIRTLSLRSPIPALEPNVSR